MDERPSFGFRVNTLETGLFGQFSHVSRWTFIYLFLFFFGEEKDGKQKKIKKINQCMRFMGCNWCATRSSITKVASNGNLARVSSGHASYALLRAWPFRCLVKTTMLDRKQLDQALETKSFCSLKLRVAVGFKYIHRKVPQALVERCLAFPTQIPIATK